MARGGKRPGSGRKKKDVKLKLIEGNPGKRTIETEPMPEINPISASVSMRCPDFLTADQKKAWHYFKRILDQAGIIEKSDVVALSMTALFYERWVMAAKKVSEGLLLKDSAGLIAENPYVRLEKEFSMRCLKMLDALGLTPAARSRLKTFGPQLPGEDDFDKFQQEKNTGNK